MNLVGLSPMNQLFSRFTHHVSRITFHASRFTHHVSRIFITFHSQFGYSLGLTQLNTQSQPPAPLIRGVEADLSPLEVVANARFIGQLQSGLRLVVGLGLSERRRLIVRTPSNSPAPVTGSSRTSRGESNELRYYKLKCVTPNS